MVFGGRIGSNCNLIDPLNGYGKGYFVLNVWLRVTSSRQVAFYIIFTFKMKGENC